MSLYYYIYICILKIEKNKWILYMSILTLYFIYNIHFSVYYLDDTGNQGNVFMGRTYQAYNPNYVPTSEGFRAELDSREIYEIDSREIYRGSDGQIGEVIRQRKPFQRVPNPSHFQSAAPTHSDLIGSIHPSDESYNIGVIEPTRSEIEHNGFYYAGSNSNIPKPTPNFREHGTSLSTIVKEKMKNFANKINEDHKRNIVRSVKREDDYNKYMRRLYKYEFEINNSERYVKGLGRLSKAEVTRLYKKGKIIKNGKIVKM